MEHLNILSGLDNLHTLNLYNRSRKWPKIEGVDAFGKVSRVCLVSNGFHWPSDFDLARLGNLKHLCLATSEGGFLPQLNSFSALTSLETFEVNIAHGALPDFRPLSTCGNLYLVTLGIAEVSETSFDVLADLSELRSLRKVVIKAGTDYEAKKIENMAQKILSCDVDVVKEWSFRNQLAGYGFDYNRFMRG